MRMNASFTLLATIASLLAGQARGTLLPSIPVDDLFARADVVAVVEIESGQMVRTATGGCGARYVGRVVERLKGIDVSTNEITFGPYSGRALGAKYLVFLTRKDRRFDPMASTNSLDASIDREWEGRCAAIIPELREMHHGMATLDVSWTIKFGYEDAVKFAPEYVAPPAGLKRKPVEPGDNSVPTDEYWVRLEPLVKHLRRGQESR